MYNGLEKRIKIWFLGLRKEVQNKRVPGKKNR